MAKAKVAAKRIQSQEEFNWITAQLIFHSAAAVFFTMGMAILFIAVQREVALWSGVIFFAFYLFVYGLIAGENEFFLVFGSIGVVIGSNELADFLFGRPINGFAFFLSIGLLAMMGAGTYLIKHRFSRSKR